MPQATFLEQLFASYKTSPFARPEHQRVKQWLDGAVNWRGFLRSIGDAAQEVRIHCNEGNMPAAYALWMAHCHFNRGRWSSYLPFIPLLDRLEVKARRDKGTFLHLIDALATMRYDL